MVCSTELDSGEALAAILDVAELNERLSEEDVLVLEGWIEFLFTGTRDMLCL